MDLPVIDHINKYHFLSIDKTRACVDKKIPYLEELMSNLTAVKEDKILSKSLEMGKDKDKVQSVDRSKVRMELICDGYNAH